MDKKELEEKLIAKINAAEECLFCGAREFKFLKDDLQPKEGNHIECLKCKEHHLFAGGYLKELADNNEKIAKTQ